MRVFKYLKKEGIGIHSFNYVCDYLNLDRLHINTKLSDEKIALIDSTLNDVLFNQWLKIRHELDKVEIKNATIVIKPLFYNSVDPVNELLAERIFNSILFLISRLYFNHDDAINLKQIILSDSSNVEKISELKKCKPFIRKMKEEDEEEDEEIRLHRKRGSSNYDPYENFHWGGLSGEEAFDGYWNTN